MSLSKDNSHPECNLSTVFLPSIDNHSQYLDGDTVCLYFRSPTKESPCIQGSDYSSPLRYPFISWAAFHFGFSKFQEGFGRQVYSVRQTLQYSVSTARGQCALGQEVGTGTGWSAPDITTSTPALSLHTKASSLSSRWAGGVEGRARAHTYTSRALSGLSDAIRVGLGLQPPWGCPLAKQKSVYPPPTSKGGGVCVWLCNGLRTTRTDGWTGLTAADYHQPTTPLHRPTTSGLLSSVVHYRFLDLANALLHRFQDKHLSQRTLPTFLLLSSYVYDLNRSPSLFSLSLFLSTGTSLRSIDVTFSRYDLEMCVYRDARLS